MKISCFDRISKEKQKLEFQTTWINFTIAALLSLGFYLVISKLNILVEFFLFIISSMVFSFFFHKVRSFVSDKYKEKIDRIKWIDEKTIELRQQVDNIYSKYPSRKNGQQFKTAFSLVGKSLMKLEETLAAGMFKEGKEVFVTAFMKNNRALRVTATIGREGYCFNSDDLKKWSNHFNRLKCDEILQYHNHPVTNNSTKPSAVDCSTTRTIKNILGKNADKLKSLIIFWNQIAEWRVLEYDESGKYEIVRSLDANEIQKQ